MKLVATFAETSGWDVVLLSEVRADGKGIVWLGQVENLKAIVHLERAQGEALKRWCEGGQRKKWDERHISVKVNERVICATYMPVKVNGNGEEIEGEVVGACELGREKGSAGGGRRLECACGWK